MKILYVTDLHGDKNKYRKSLEIAMKQEIRVIVNGGDMLPKLGERHTEQPLFIKGFLSNYFSILQEHNITYLNMLGNDDLLSVDNLFEQTCGGFANVHNIAGKKIRIDEYEFIGMNQILDHPFGCKDRVVTETDYIPQRQLSLFAGISNEYGYDRIFDWLEYSKTELPLMCGILKELPEPESPKKTVYVMHMPPAGLRLGQLLYQDLDIGSVDIYEFLKAKQPLLSLHGHIHESPDTEKGSWMNQIGILMDLAGVYGMLRFVKRLLGVFSLFRVYSARRNRLLILVKLAGILPLLLRSHLRTGMGVAARVCPADGRLGLLRLNDIFLRRCRAHSIARDFAACHADESAAEKACRSRAPTAGFPGCRSRTVTAAASQCAADRAGRGVDGAHGDHRLREHRAAGMPNVQTETGQEAVDLLRHFQKGNGAQKPNQHIAGDGFLPGSTDCGFYITLRNSECVS